MTGSGTQANPYIVSTWSDFITAATISTDTYIEFVPNTVIDLNNVQPEGFSSALSLAGHIDGKNSVIKNLVVNDQYGRIFAVSGLDMKNISFLNMRGSRKIFERRMSTSSLTLYKCQFSGRLDNPDNIIYMSRGSCSRCSFTLEVHGSGNVRFNWDRDYSVQYCRIDISGTNTGNYIDIGNVNNCYITGKHSTKIEVYGNTNIVDFSAPAFGSDSFAHDILVNSSKCASIQTLPGVHACTTSQLKNAEYLASIGFPVET